jgi:hypothetical protein
LHYNKENKLNETFGDYVEDAMSRSSCILFVLSDSFLMREWQNKRFQEHLRHLILKEKSRFLAVQMHDVCDEEVEEYFTEKLQIPRFVALESDEFLFWQKLGYFLYTNGSTAPCARPNKIKDISRDAIVSRNEKFSSQLFSKHATPDPYSSSTSFDLPSISYFNEDSNSYNSSSRIFAKSKKKENMHKKIIMNRTSKSIFLNERKPVLMSDTFGIRHDISDDSFNFIRSNELSLNINRKSSSSSSERDYMNTLIYQQKVASNKNGRYPSVKKNSFRSTSDSDNQ